MVVYQKKNEILLVVRQEITRYGLHAFRVEELARRMGISKRTIYRIFPAKADILKECIAQMTLQLREKISLVQQGDNAGPLEKGWKLIQLYLDSLYDVESVLLWELKQLPDYRGSYLGVRGVWTETLKYFLLQGQQQGYIREDTECHLFCERLLTALYEARVEEELPHAQQWMFCQTLFRGILTEKGKCYLEKQK